MRHFRPLRKSIFKPRTSLIQMPNKPLFSIIIPSYNCAQYIQQTLRSIYQQTEDDYEIVVINDGSPDNLLEVLKQETDSRLRVITQPNSGVSCARNRGIQEARGTYVAFLDSDDVWQPFHLEKAKLFFEKYPQFHWYATNVVYAETINDVDFSRKAPDKTPFYHSSWFLEFGPVPLSSTIVLKRDMAIKHLHFPEGIQMYEDNVAWSRFAIHAGAIGTIDEPTAIYRQRNGSLSANFNLGWPQSSKDTGLKALLLQQQMLLELPCPAEAHRYFRIRSLYNWYMHLSCIRRHHWSEEIKQRRFVTGNFVTLLLFLYEKSFRILTRVMQKIVTMYLHKLQKVTKKYLQATRKRLS